MKKQGAIIILGGGIIKNAKNQWHSTKFNGPVFASHLRVLAGYYLFKKNPNIIIFSSGGKGYLKKNPEAPTVSRVIKNELIVLGVPTKSIQEEGRSNNTFQSIQEIKKIISAIKIGKIDIITNKYHLGRVRTFINQDVVLKKHLANGRIGLISAETIVRKHNPELKNKITKLYQSNKMKKVIDMEKTGINQIRNRTYDINSNTSRSNIYK